MVYNLLMDIIGGRDVNKMPCSEARKIVGTFYDELYRRTFGQRHPKKVDFLAEQALKRAGLEFFA